MSDSDSTTKSTTAVPEVEESLKKQHSSSPQKEEAAHHDDHGHHDDDHHDEMIAKSAHDHHDGKKVMHDGDDGVVVRDVIMWRRRKISAGLVVVATVVWVMLEIYRCNFVPLASYTAMGFVTLLFLYGCALALLRKEVEGTKGWEISEESAKNMAKSTKRALERGIQLMFHISCEREWYYFAGVVTALLLLGYLARHFNILTLLYAGTMLGMTVPVIYTKKEEQIKAYGQRLRAEANRLYTKFEDKVFSKLNSKEELFKGGRSKLESKQKLKGKKIQ